jgi:molybdopterin/thiamine biosynthesis adenylyltransferase
MDQSATFTGHEAAWDRVQRQLGDAAFAQLGRKHVVVAGIGSGGGFAALSLAMTGVSHFTLIDPDTITLANVVRHVADRRDVGRPKVEALADLIRTRNPAAVVNAIVGRLEDHMDSLSGADLMVVGVDDERPKYAINEACRQFNLTAVYAGIYERGEGGDVAVIIPHQGPCYACWSLLLREPLTTASQPEHTALDYGQARSDGTFAAEPGLWLHVVRVAAAQADCALNELLRDTPAHSEFPANTLILANRAMEIMPGVTLPPYGAQWVAIPRDPDCLVCGSDYRTDQAMDLDTLVGDLLAPDP